MFGSFGTGNTQHSEPSVSFLLFAVSLKTQLLMCTVKSMQYHTAVIVLFQSVNLRRDDEGPVPRLLSAKAAKSIALRSAVSVSSLMSRHPSSWEAGRLPVADCQYIIIALYALLDDLDTRENRDAFANLCTYAQAFARRWVFAKGALRSLEIVVRRKQKTLPDTAERIFAEFERDIWKEGDSALYSSSFHVGSGNMLLADQQDKPSEMDEMLKQWNGLQLSSTGPD